MIIIEILMVLVIVFVVVAGCSCCFCCFCFDGGIGDVVGVRLILGSADGWVSIRSLLSFVSWFR